jgi:hypothetical protein
MLNPHAENEGQEHHSKRFKIIVNARSKEVTDDDQSFEQIVGLAFSPVPVDPNIVFTVTFRKGPRENPEGTLTPGESVEIKDGMIFDVTATTKS